MKVFSIEKFKKDNWDSQAWILKCDGLTESEMMEKYSYETHPDWMVDIEDWKPYKEEKMTQSEIYKKLQAEWVRLVDLKVGDKVKVIGKAKDHQFGWQNDWIKEMNKMVGKTYEVIDTTNFGIVLCDYCFPFFVLEKVEEEMIDIDGTKWSKSTVKEALRKHANFD